LQDQIAASIEGFFWPKFFWDFLTTNFDPAVKPIPILQTVNLVFGILILAWEWPLKQFAGTALHRSFEARLLLFPLLALAAVLMYQSTNAALYYLIGEAMYFWAFSEGEVSRLRLTVCCFQTNHLSDNLRRAMERSKAPCEEKALLCMTQLFAAFL